MAINTTDVLTSAVSTTDTPKNGTIVVTVSPTLGSIKTNDDHVINTPTHSGVQSRYTAMFDEVAYYNTPSGISGGGA